MPQFVTVPIQLSTGSVTFKIENNAASTVNGIKNPDYYLDGINYF